MDIGIFHLNIGTPALEILHESPDSKTNLIGTVRSRIKIELFHIASRKQSALLFPQSCLLID